jgi:phosphoglycerate dehydrogenase-like enzyme
MVWTQWADLALPGGVEYAKTDGDVPALEDRGEIEFYVPRYMGGPASLAPIADMPRLKVVQMLTAGYEDALAHLPAGVRLCNARGVHDESTAELAVGLAIAARRGFAEFARAGRWAHEVRPTLTDARVAVVGSGSIGGTIARMLSGFTVTVDRYSRTGSAGSTEVGELPERIGAYDVVILALPLTDATRGMFGRDLLAKMRRGALLVNVARGPIVDTAALVELLHAGHLAAALDVTDPEPLPPDHPLWTAPNCLITPHVGGDTLAFEPRGRRLIEEQVMRFHSGRPLTNVVA